MLDEKFKNIYGPVPSRRLGLSLGVSPLPKKTCNYSCVYCQLGITKNMSNIRQNFYPVDDILDELSRYVEQGTLFDAVTIVGEGEPTLYKDLGTLIWGIKKIIPQKPVVVITNGALLYEDEVKKALESADIIMPSLDYYDAKSFKRINRHLKELCFDKVYKGLVDFSASYPGQLWLEVMLVKGYNDSEQAIEKIASLAKSVRYDKIYINTVARPPAVKNARAVSRCVLEKAVEVLHGVSIENLVSTGFSSEIKDDYEAVLSIIKRHPMNQFEILSFLNGRGNVKGQELLDKMNMDEQNGRGNVKGQELLDKMNMDEQIEKVKYMNYITYRYK